MRTFQQTHPWLKFAADFNRVGFRLWILLGEARSKCEHVAGVPLRPDNARKLSEIYLGKGAHATTSIEGNTLSEEEVLKRVKGGLKLPHSQEYLVREVDNILEAYNQITQELLSRPDLPLTPEHVCSYNEIILQNLELEDDVVPGEYRKHSVGVAGYRGAPAEDCEHLIKRLCDWLNGPDFRSSDPEMSFALAFFKAVLAHLYIAWIHPFGDGNGRTARLVEFQLLAQSGLVPIPGAHLLSDHYNRTRTRYYAELDKASKTGGEVVGFIAYAAEGFVDGLRGQLELIRNQQWTVTWENYVHDQFHGLDTATHTRRKHLVLDMPAQPVPRNRITQISTRVAKDYAGKTERTVARDLNALLEMGLVVKAGRSYVAARTTILAFLPPKCPDTTPPRKTGRQAGSRKPTIRSKTKQAKLNFE